MQKTTINIRLSVEAKEALYKLAKLEDRKPADVARRSVIAYLRSKGFEADA